jgi:hypothetical protein
MRLWLAVALFALLGLTPGAAASRPIEVRVVIVATWEAELNGHDLLGELHAWRTEWPLTVSMPFPAG